MRGRRWWDRPVRGRLRGRGPDGEDDAEADGPVIVSSKVHQIGGTLDAVHFRLAEQDSFMQIARELPAIAEAPLLSWLTTS